MPKIDTIELVAKLTHELGVALEMSFMPEEFSSLWPEAVDALIEAKLVLVANGRPFPGAADNIILAAKRTSH